jgi:hypothetical protein
MKLNLPPSLHVSIAFMTAVQLVSSSAVIANPAPLLLDSFDAPNASSHRVVKGKPDNATSKVVLYESNLPVRTGARDTGLNMYENPLNSLAAISVGNGNLNIAQGAKVRAETTIAYGAFTRIGGNPTVGGPFLKLNLKDYKNLQLDFTGAEDGLNINVIYYTAAPVTPNVYYSTKSINIAPPSPSAPLTVKLPMNNDSKFNWQQVDGIMVIINRSGGEHSTSYTLDALKLIP